VSISIANVMPARPLQLRKAVGPDQANYPFDVLAVKDALARLGAYSLARDGFSPEPTKALFHAIRFHQDGRKLKIDGIVAPNGETARDIGGLIHDIGARSPWFRCIIPNCGKWHGDMYGTGVCEDCTAKEFDGLKPSEIMNLLDGPEEIPTEGGQ
jgi:hypothetical protein